MRGIRCEIISIIIGNLREQHWECDGRAQVRPSLFCGMPHVGARRAIYHRQICPIELATLLGIAGRPLGRQILRSLSSLPYGPWRSLTCARPAPRMLQAERTETVRRFSRLKPQLVDHHDVQRSYCKWLVPIQFHVTSSLRRHQTFREADPDRIQVRNLQSRRQLRRDFAILFLTAVPGLNSSLLPLLRSRSGLN